MNWLLIAVVVAPLIMWVTRYIVSEKPPRRTQVQELAARIEKHGLPAILAEAQNKWISIANPLQAAAASAQAKEDQCENWRRDHASSTIPSGAKLIPHTVFVILLAVIGVFCFVASQSLDVGLVQTMNIGDKQGLVIGTTLAVVTALFGIILAELTMPGDVYPGLKNQSLRERMPSMAGVGVLYLGLIAGVAHLAPHRSEVALGAAMRDAQASCVAAGGDPRATEGQRQQVCGEFEQRKGTLEAAQSWDRMVAVAAPLGEGIGMWGLLRVLEGAMALTLSLRAIRARRRTSSATAALQRRFDEFIAFYTQAIVEAGGTPEEIQAARAAVLSPQGRDGGLPEEEPDNVSDSVSGDSETQTSEAPNSSEEDEFVEFSTVDLQPAIANGYHPRPEDRF